MQSLRCLSSILTLVLLATWGLTGSADPPVGGREQPPTSPRLAFDPLKPAGFATIKGKVTYVGVPPIPAELPIPDNNKDKDYCLKGEHHDQTWVVGPGKGVANVVVWLRPPEEMFFDVPPEQQKPEQTSLKIDQPFCAFTPHVTVAYPTFFDMTTRRQKRTGQKLEVVNSAPIAHNVNWLPVHHLFDSGNNVILRPKNGVVEIEALNRKPNQPNLQNLFTLRCNIHPWMIGYIWAFDHPYAAVTREDGSFEIKRVPAGSKLRIVAWHEPDLYLAPDGARLKKLMLPPPTFSWGTEIGPLADKEVLEVDFKVSKELSDKQHLKSPRP